MYLVVVNPFLDYRRGDVITNSTLIAQYLASAYVPNVVLINPNGDVPPSLPDFLAGNLALGTGSTSFLELTGTGYSRKAITFGPMVVGRVSNRAASSFSAGGTWPSATQYAIYDASNNLMFWWLNPSPFTLTSGGSSGVSAGLFQLIFPDLVNPPVSATVFFNADAQIATMAPSTVVIAGSDLEENSGVLSYVTPSGGGGALSAIAPLAVIANAGTATAVPTGVLLDAANFAINGGKIVPTGTVTSVNTTDTGHVVKQGGSPLLYARYAGWGGFLALGSNAGAAIISAGTTPAIGTTLVGGDSGKFLTTGGENTYFGNLTGVYNATGDFNTVMGDAAMWHDPNSSNNSYFGCDTARNYCSPIGSNTGIGQSVFHQGGGNQNTAVGQGCMSGNGGVILLTGSITTTDVITITNTSQQATFTGTISGNTLTVSGVTGTIAIGQYVDGVGVTSCQITAGSGSTWTVGGGAQTVGPVAMTGGAFAKFVLTVPMTGLSTLAQAATAITAAYNAVSAWYRSGERTASVRDSVNVGIYGLGNSASGDFLAIGTSVSGAATEVLTVTNGSSGFANIAIGYRAMFGAYQAASNYNVCIASNSMYALTTGTGNIGIGYNVLNSLTTATGAIAIGYDSANNLTTSTGVTIVGYQAGKVLTGATNTMIGYRAGWNQTTGTGTTVVGANAGPAGAATNCTVIGANALGNASATGTGNTALGASALQNLNTAGTAQTAVGASAMAAWVGTDASLTNANVAVGYLTGFGGASSTYFGATLVGIRAGFALTSGASNTLIGARAGEALTTGGNNVLIGWNVARTTLQTGTNNIIVSANSTPVDVPATSTSFMLNIQNSIAGVLAGGTNPRINAVGMGGVLGVLKGANFNVTTDQAIVIDCETSSSAGYLSSSAKYVITEIRVVFASGASLTTAQGAFYTAASKTGTVIGATTTAYTGVTGAGKQQKLSGLAGMDSDVFTAATLYLSLTTAQGAAATADVYVFGYPLS